MNQDQIATLFRKTELENRVRRLRALSANAQALLHEPLTPRDEAITKLAKEQIEHTRLTAERIISPGYWKRLWRALLGR